jgi:hypothetical protein
MVVLRNVRFPASRAELLRDANPELTLMRSPERVSVGAEAANHDYSARVRNLAEPAFFDWQGSTLVWWRGIWTTDADLAEESGGLDLTTS